jgi:hypothetical protein
MSIRTFSLALILICCAASAIGATLSMDVTFTGTAITVAPVPPGHRIVLFGAGHEPALFQLGTFCHSIVLTESGAGSVTYEPEGGVAARSVWIAVDLDTAESSLSLPDAGPTLIDFAPETLLRSDPTKSLGATGDRVTDSRSAVDYLLVRPGAGAWTLYVDDGGAADEDGINDGTYTFAVSAMTPLTGAPAPTALADGDVLIGIDRMELEYFTTRIQP